MPNSGPNSIEIVVICNYFIYTITVVIVIIFRFFVKVVSARRDKK